MASNTSSDAVQQQSIMKIETLESVDYSQDCSQDWDAFSFESEISARANIYKSNLQALKLMADATTSVKWNDKNIATEFQEYVDVYSELLSKYRKCNAKYKAVIRSYKNVKQNVENLRARCKDVKRTIKELEEENSNSLKEYQQLKVALDKGLEMYTTHFNINVTTESLTDTTYKATLRFNEKKNVGHITFVVDRVKRKVIDFQANEVLLPEEEKDIRNKFGKLDNLSGLLCALREIVLRK